MQGRGRRDLAGGKRRRLSGRGEGEISMPVPRIAGTPRCSPMRSRSLFVAQVAMYAVDSLRQLVSKLLARAELSHFTHQEEALRPFRVILKSVFPCVSPLLSSNAPTCPLFLSQPSALV